MSTNWKKLYIRKNCDLPTFCGVEQTAYEQIWKITKKPKAYLFAHFKDKHFTYYLQGVDENKIGRVLYKKYFAEPKQIVKAYLNGKRFLRRTQKKTENWHKILSKNLKNNLLYKAFADFEKEFGFVNFNYSIMPWWALEAWQHDFEKIIGNLIEKRELATKFELIMNSLLKPWKTTAIVKVGQELRKGTANKKLLKKYQFLRSWTVVWHKPLTSEWIKSTAHLLDNQNLLTHEQLLKLLRPNKQEKKFIQNAPYIVFFKDWRDDLRREHAFRWSFLFDLMAKYFKVEREDLGYYTLDELAEALKTDSLDINLLKNRKGKEFILTIKLPSLKLIVFPGVPKYFKDAISHSQQEKVEQIIKGITAQLGKVVGPVRLVHNIHDVKKIEIGDVLVTNTTHPNYLMGMKKAAAFVTDEGGIASHAAIVAREFKKPCIVGTKIATKILKDGDLVEVNANEGIVKILKK